MDRNSGELLAKEEVFKFNRLCHGAVKEFDHEEDKTRWMQAV